MEWAQRAEASGPRGRPCRHWSGAYDGHAVHHDGNGTVTTCVHCDDSASTSGPVDTHSNRHDDASQGSRTNANHADNGTPSWSDDNPAARPSASLHRAVTAHLPLSIVRKSIMPFPAADLLWVLLVLVIVVVILRHI